MKRRLISVLLAMVMLVAITGCSQKGGNDGVVTLSVLMPGDVQDGWSEVLDEINKITEEKIGAKIDMQFINAGSFSEKMRMNMASNTYFDICFTGYVNNYSQAVQNGGIMDITEYIDKHDMRDILPEDVWEAATIDGRIYGVPNYQIVATANSLVVFDELAKKYNFDWSAVKNIDDIEPYLAMVKASEPDIYPYRPYYGYGMWTLDYESITKMIALPKGSQSADDLVYLYDTPGFNHGIQQLHNWYKKGYIRRDALSMGDDSTDYKSGKYAVSNMVWKPGAEVQESTNTGKSVSFVQVENPYMTRTKCLNTMLALGVNCKNPDKAMEYIKLVNTDKELFNLFVFGIEGKHYTKENDVVKPIAGGGYNNSGYAWMFGNTFNAYIMEGQQPDVWEQTKKVNDESEKSTLIGYVFDNTNVKSEISNVSTVIAEYKVMEVGSKDPAEYIDTFKQKLKDAGVENIYDEVKKQLTEYFAAK